MIDLTVFRLPAWRIFPVVVIFIAITLRLPAAASASSGLFPLYPEIRANVDFWEKVYSTYSLKDAVIHDSEDLSKVYEVIHLGDDAAPGATRSNEQIRKAAVEKYSRMLEKLARYAPSNATERRIAAMFNGRNPHQRMARAAENVRCQTGQKERFWGGVVESAKYMADLRKIFRSYQLPDELTYLPHVESSFNTKAYSKYGAAGIWQFTRVTGKQYLNIDYIIDERLDPLMASHAAAKYLQKSYSHLRSWPLAITSYNYGLPGMIRAKEKHGRYDRIYKYHDGGYFKFASKNFYSEFLAALRVARRLEARAEFQQASRGSFRYYRLPGYARLSDISHQLLVGQATIKELNPALREPVTSGEKYIPKGYNLRLPGTGKAPAQIAQVPSAVFQNEQKKTLYHRVNVGETASSIAKKYGIARKDLIAANNLDRYATIYTRQKLRIPSRMNSTLIPVSAKEAKPEREQPILTASKKVYRTTAPTKGFIPKKNPSVYNVTNKRIKGSIQYGTITVQPEESIELYAKWLKTEPEQIYAMNRLDKDVQVMPGAKLRLVFQKIAPDDFEDARLDYLQETEDDFFAAYAVVTKQTYKIAKGDTLWNLCYNKFDIPMWLLERYNSNIDLARLQENQELVIPIVKGI